MWLVAKLHPVLVHCPIGLVLTAAVTELLAIFKRRRAWRAFAIVNLRVGAAMGAITAVAGWALASTPLVEPTPLLMWHRWLGVAGALGALGAALLSTRCQVESQRSLLAYQVALFAATALVAIAGHLGGTLVWGADFLHP